MDALLRAVLAEVGGFDFAVSEFVRVSQGVLSAATISKRVPEITGVCLGRTVLPTQVQLLGSNPDLLAGTALEACAAGARAIDLNFGCPSPTVIRHRGGSALLKTPRSIFEIVSCVRRNVPSVIPVSAKIRLGFQNPEEVFDIAQAAADGGADWLVIHARTRAEFYRPGVHWEPVRQVKEKLGIPIIANGDIFSVQDFERCRKETGCEHFMLGRGALLDPFLGHRILDLLGRQKQKSLLNQKSPSQLEGLITAIARFIEIAEPLAQNSGFIPSRIKQWIRISRAFELEFIPRALLTVISRAKTGQDILEQLEQFSGFSSAEIPPRA